MTERAQSETLGFVFVFVLILGSMSLLTVIGVAELGDVRDTERLHNAERAFETLDANVEDLVAGGLPSQATEINLAGARIYHGAAVTWTVSGTSVADPDENFSYDVTLRPVVYESESGSETKIVFANGAVFRQEPGGTATIEPRRFVLSPDRTSLLLVQTRPGRQSSGIAGTTTARVRTVRPETELYRANRTAYDLTISVDTPRAEAWEGLLDRYPGTTCSTPTASRVTCSLRTDAVYVTVARVDVRFE